MSKRLGGPQAAPPGTSWPATAIGERSKPLRRGGAVARLVLRGVVVAVLVAGAGGLRGARASEPEGLVKGLIARMTLEEKVGQLNLLSGDHAETGPYMKPDLEAALLAGEVGGVYNAYGAAYVERMQRLAVGRTRLGIPLLVGLDVIHGYRTIFPVPLGQAATFDLALIERAERIAATEAASAGVAWTFAPMLDVARDPRWGRVVEGAGESSWLATRIAAARVRGLQGRSLRDLDSVAGCAKHLAGYGAVEGGREYGAADVSERTLQEVYLPPFAAAVWAGVPCVMAGFVAIDGVPGTANDALLDHLLRRAWQFDGITVSDFGAIEELRAHGVAADLDEAAALALAAGTDVDMQSEAYREALPALVRGGRVPEAQVDRAVARVLDLKARLGLLDDPFARTSTEREAATLFTEASRSTALDLATQSLVLLRNEGAMLPFATEGVRRVALIGPLADSPSDTLGPWAADGKPADAVTLAEGVRRVVPAGVEVVVQAAGTVWGTSASDLSAARDMAAAADLVILALGETARMSGEAASRAHIDLPGDQLALARAVLAVGKPTAVVLMNGRPLAIPELAAEAPAILEAWFPGSMGGLAVARALFGLDEPGGRLPMTFPRSTGQIPIYHDQRPTGRPSSEAHYSSRYIDEAFTPLFPFGFGLGYTTFDLSAPELDRAAIRRGETATVAVEVVNTGERRGTAVVQLYIRDLVASVSRPVRELRGIARTTLEPGQRRTVRLPVGEADLAFWRRNGSFGAEPGAFDVMTGPNSAATRSTRLTLLP